MLQKRLIPCLTLLNNSFVKTLNFKEPKYIGDPINTIKIFNEKFVDEIMILDIGATKHGLEPNYKLLSDIASECFIPLGYGGGIRNLKDASKIIEIGFEKICLQSGVIKNSQLIYEISKKFGSQSCLVSVDVKKDLFGRYQIYNYLSGTYYKDLKLECFLRKIINHGAGEIIINLVNNDGKRSGMDLKLIEKLSRLFSVPIIFVGGVGKLEHVKSAFKVGAKAVGGGSFFVLHGEHRAVLVSYPKEQDFKN
jgi:cyclase